MNDDEYGTLESEREDRRVGRAERYRNGNDVVGSTKSGAMRYQQCILEGGIDVLATNCDVSDGTDTKQLPGSPGH